MAMTDIEPLIDLQDVDGRIRELELELKDLPRRRALETARLNGSIADLESAKAALAAVNSRVRSDEEEAKAAEEKISQLKIAQTSLKTNKEYAQYSMQIDIVQKEIEGALERIAAATAPDGDVAAAERRLADAQAKYDGEKVGVDKFCAEIDERITALEGELAAAKEERTEKARNVTDPKYKLYYERLRTKRWPVVVPLTPEGVCDGCHLVQPPHVAQLVDRNAGMVACTMCGRILYR